MVSKHECPVVQIRLEKHPYADSLSLVYIEGHTVIIKTAEWKDGDLAIHIAPDYVCPDRPEFAFLGSNKRVKPRKFCNIISDGILIKAPEGAIVGQNMMDELGIVRYETIIELDTKGECEAGPGIYSPKYDIESYKKYHTLIRSGEEVQINEKIHGCFNSNTRVRLSDGSSRRIADIYKDDSIKEVLGFDFKSGNVTSTKIVNKFKNGLSKDWLKIEFTRHNIGRGSYYGSIICTPEHEIFLGSYNKFVQAKSLQTGDELTLLRSELNITPIQEQVLIGKLLGDGSFSGVSEESASIHFGHKKDHEEYLQWTEHALGDICGERQKEHISGYGSTILRSRTVSLPKIKHMMLEWISNNKKIIPDSIIKTLTPIAMAFWYMDDGSLGHGDDGAEDKANFAVCNFSKNDCAKLLLALKKFGINGVYFTSGSYSRIRLNSDDAEKFFLLISPYIPPIMQYKLPERYRGHNGWMPKNDNNKYKKFCVCQKIIKITKFKQNTQRYDLETETNNYFANSVLVHNCNARYVFHDGRMYCGSRANWKRYNPTNLWWRALALNPWIEDFCKSNPDYTFYGEVFGQVQNLKYGTKPNEIRFAVFDILYNGSWLDYDEAKRISPNCTWVPELYRGPFNEKNAIEMAEKNSNIDGANHCIEGVVIQPIPDRLCNEIGRVKLKIVGNRYLMKDI